MNIWDIFLFQKLFDFMEREVSKMLSFYFFF